MIILIDNYDSFTYNLVQYLGELDVSSDVYRNDACSAQEITDKNPSGLLISPGPCAPEQAGICLELIQLAYDKNIPLFGVCLGMQAIGQAFGGEVIRAPKPMHGMVDSIHHEQEDIFTSLPSPFKATRYHSLMVNPKTLTQDLKITAKTKDDLIMGLSHKEKPIYGVQFHPESIASEHGHTLLKNFIDLCL